jgi:hypothetical protein
MPESLIIILSLPVFPEFPVLGNWHLAPRNTAVSMRVVTILRIEWILRNLPYCADRPNHSDQEAAHCTEP